MILKIIKNIIKKQIFRQLDFVLFIIILNIYQYWVKIKYQMII